MKVQTIVKGLALAGAVAFSASAMADGMPGGSLKDAPVAAPFSWTGLYIGANAGGDWGKEGRIRDEPADAASAAFSGACIAANTCPLGINGNRKAGAEGGLQLGYNLQLSSLVIGVETDVQGTTLNIQHSKFLSNTGTGFLPYQAQENTNVQWFGTTRLRAGLLVSPTALVYVTGGFAYGGVQRSYGNNFLAPAINAATYGRSSNIDTGWAAGAGFEWALTNKATIGLEYLHVNLNGDRYSSTGALPFTGGCTAANCNYSVRGQEVNQDIVRAKVNFKL